MAEPSVVPSVFYRDPLAALEWLQQAFGFELRMLLLDGEGRLAHSQLGWGQGEISVGGEWADWTRSPAGLSGANTQSLRITLESDIDAHCARAKAAGARIVAEPADQFYGARTYRALDPEGHCWVFSQAVREVSFEDMEKASGLRFAAAPAAST